MRPLKDSERSCSEDLSTRTRRQCSSWPSSVGNLAISSSKVPLTFAKQVGARPVTRPRTPRARHTNAHRCVCRSPMHGGTTTSSSCRTHTIGRCRAVGRLAVVNRVVGWSPMANIPDQVLDAIRKLPEGDMGTRHVSFKALGESIGQPGMMVHEAVLKLRDTGRISVDNIAGSGDIGSATVSL